MVSSVQSNGHQSLIEVHKRANRWAVANHFAELVGSVLVKKLRLRLPRSFEPSGIAHVHVCVV